MSKYSKCFLTKADGIIQKATNVAIEHPLIKADNGVLGPDFGTRWQPVTRPFKMVEDAHRHDYAQILAFIPGDITQLGKLDAEIEFYMAGEKHLITETTVVLIPRGVVHCPLYINRVGKPFLFNNMYFAAEYVSEKVK